MGDYEISEEVEAWSNIVALKRHGYTGMLGLKEDGTVLFQPCHKKESEGLSVEGWKLFGSLDTFEQERKAAENT